MTREAETVRKHLQDTPLVGFYGFGEIAPTAPGRPPTVHIQTAEQLSWMKTAHELPRIDRFPE